MNEAAPLFIYGMTFDDVYPDTVRGILSQGFRSSPRGMPITEVLGASLMIRDSLQGTCLLKSRKLNYAFHVIEKWEYLAGESNPERVCFYNSNMSNFLNEGKFDGAYGPRIGRQLEYVYNLLKKDPDSRQAVININAEVDKHDSKDIPCTISLQVLIRESKLNMIVTMRSNDACFGTPLDISAFTFLQEVLAFWLGVKVGWYLHQAGSLHVYDSTKEKLLEMLKDTSMKASYKRPLWDLNLEATKIWLKEAFRLEKILRTERQDIKVDNLPECLRSDIEILRLFIKRKIDKK